MMSKTLDSTFLRSTKGETIEVKTGEQVVLTNPKNLHGKIKRIQHQIISSTKPLLGNGPYFVEKIEKYNEGTTFLHIRGNNKVKIINEKYLSKI